MLRLFSNGLANSFRTETFNITTPGRTESFLLQGGQRWQSITLLTNSSTITIGSVGFKPSVQIEDLNKLSGSLATSKSVYDDVWGLGARAVQAACVEKGSQPSTWEITSDGALIRGQYPAVSAKGNGFANYTLEFSTKITQGGTGWRVVGGANGGYGAYFVLTSNGPDLGSDGIDPLARNTLTAGYGWSIVNQPLLVSVDPRSYPVSTPIEDGTWYRIATTINATGYAISVDGTDIAFVTSEEYQGNVNTGWGSASTEEGTFGFGPFLNQVAYFKDVTVTAQNGSVVYNESMTSENTPEEYAVATNQHAFCIDGPKRDRVVWIGDFVHTARILAASTGRYDFIQSMIDYEFEWQLSAGPGSGLVPIQAYQGAGEQYREAYYPSEFGETDYQHLFLLTLGDYFALTSDKDLLSQHWDSIKILVQTLVDRYIDPTTGLLGASDASWFLAQGTQNATAPTALFAEALNQLANVATVLGDQDTVEYYRQLSTELNNAINSQLWSEELGIYSFSLDQASVGAISATAFTIRGGTANTDRATRSIEALSDLFVEIGYKDTTAASSGLDAQLSPNTGGFLLEALFLAHINLNVSAETVVPAIKNMTEIFWPKMVTQNEYYTGASWEYMLADGSPAPGGVFASLGHPWGGAPTYIYTNYVLGVRSEWDESQGKYGWVFDPAWEILEGLGLEWAKGRVPLESGGYIDASWSIENGDWATPVMEGKVVDSKVIGLDVKKRS